jgi:hypothetical protein
VYDLGGGLGIAYPPDERASRETIRDLLARSVP